MHDGGNASRNSQYTGMRRLWCMCIRLIYTGALRIGGQHTYAKTHLVLPTCRERYRSVLRKTKHTAKREGGEDPEKRVAYPRQRSNNFTAVSEGSIPSPTTCLTPPYELRVFIAREPVTLERHRYEHALSGKKAKTDSASTF